MERANTIDYILNEVYKTIIIRNNKKRIIDPNNNKENILEEESTTTQRKLCGDRSTTTGGIRSLFIAVILAESEDTRIVNNNKHTNDEIVQVIYIICIDSDIDKNSNCNTEDSDFVVDDEDITGFHEEEDERRFMSKDWKWKSWEEVGDD